MDREILPEIVARGAVTVAGLAPRANRRCRPQPSTARARMMPPAPGGQFRWVETLSGLVLACEPLERTARHAFTSRQLRLRGDSLDGWTKTASAVGCGVGAVRRVRQVHGADVQVVDDTPPDGAWPIGDALVTCAPGVALAVVTADCVPVLLADPVSGAVGAVHAGWRGTAADVTGAAVRTMAEHWDIPPARLVAAIGPSIGACCYEVGEELVGAFAAAGHDQASRRAWFSQDGDGRLRLDLWAANRDLLLRAGLSASQIHLAGLCTRTHLAWFESYRAEGAAAGRMTAVVVSGPNDASQPRPEMVIRDRDGL
jgi:YfiH family protein